MPAALAADDDRLAIPAFVEQHRSGNVPR